MTENIDVQKAAKPRFSWNPMVPIRDGGHAREMAVKGGLICVALLAAGYVLMSVIMLAGGTSPYAAGADPTMTLAIHGVLLAFAGFLAWRIKTSQPVWAAWVVLVWLALETAGKIFLALQGGGFVGFVINILGLLLAVQAVRGAIWIRRNRAEA